MERRGGKCIYQIKERRREKGDKKEGEKREWKISYIIKEKERKEKQNYKKRQGNKEIDHIKWKKEK